MEWCVHVLCFGRQREYQLRAHTKTSCDWFKKQVVQQAQKAKTSVGSIATLQIKNRGLFPDQFSIGGKMNSRP